MILVSTGINDNGARYPSSGRKKISNQERHSMSFSSHHSMAISCKAAVRNSCQLDSSQWMRSMCIEMPEGAGAVDGFEEIFAN
jgi:hypothetical protein